MHKVEYGNIKKFSTPHCFQLTHTHTHTRTHAHTHFPIARTFLQLHMRLMVPVNLLISSTIPFVYFCSFLNAVKMHNYAVMQLLFSISSSYLVLKPKFIFSVRSEYPAFSIFRSWGMSVIQIQFEYQTFLSTL